MLEARLQNNYHLQWVIINLNENNLWKLVFFVLKFTKSKQFL